MQVDYTPAHDTSPAGVVRATGREFGEWFRELDARGGPQQGRRALGEALLARKLDTWWATTLLVEYEKARGVTDKDGAPRGYNLCVTKSVAAPPARVYDALLDTRVVARAQGILVTTGRRDLRGRRRSLRHVEEAGSGQGDALHVGGGWAPGPGNRRDQAVGGWCEDIDCAESQPPARPVGGRRDARRVGASPRRAQGEPRVTRLVLAAAFVGVVTVSAADTDLEWRLYLASVAAADGALRSNETSAARHWLDEAPSRHRGWEWRYLRARADESLQVVGAHDAVITGLAASPDGQWLATSSSDKTVRVWDAQSGARVATLEGHGAPTWSPAFRPGSPQLASMGSDGSVRLWDWRQATELRRFEKLGNGMGAVAWSPDGALLCGTTWTFEPGRGVVGWIRLWDLASDRLLWKADYGVKPITTVAFRPDGRQLAVGTWDGWVGFFAVDGGGRPSNEIKLAAEGTYPAMQGVAYSPDGATLVATAKDGVARAYRSADGSLVRAMTGHRVG